MTERPLVFIGPSMPRRGPLAGVTVLPPAVRGDLTRALSEGYRSFVLIDGSFMERAPITHGELVAVLRAGASLIGAASTGALRASELHSLGMKGVGSVYRAIMADIVTDDSEVAVAMCPYQHTALTVSLVDVRGLLGTAYAQGVSMTTLRVAFKAARDIHFASRTPAKLADAWRVTDLLRGVTDHFLTCADSVKKSDAATAMDVAIRRPVHGGEEGQRQALYTDDGVVSI